MKKLLKNGFFKTCAAFLLSVALFLPAFSFWNSGEVKADVEHVIRDYSALDDTDRFMIGGFYGADVTTDEGVTLLKNSGLDFTTMYGNHFEDITSLYFSSGNTSVIRAIYDRLHAAGLKIMIEGGRGTQPAATGMTGVKNVSGIPYDYSNISPTATTYGAWSEIGMGLSYDDVVIGSQLWDEPFDSEIDIMDDYLARYESAFPDKLFFVNLFARESIDIGNFDLNGDGYADSRDYIYYVKHYANNVVDNMTNDNIKMISTDPYPFNRVNTDSPSYYYINPYYFTTLATSAIEAKAHGASLSYYVQTMDCSQESQPYKNSRDVKGMADISMQYNIAMAFGAKQIINFCYETPDIDDQFLSEALVTAAGVPTTRYTCVQTAAYKAHSIGQAFMRFNWNGTVIAKGTVKDRFSTTYNRVGSSTFNCYGDLNTIYGGNYYYKSLVPYASEYNSNANTRTNLSGNNLLNVASSQTAMVGCFTDDAGYNGYMLASGDDAISGASTAMALTFDSSTDKVRIFNGVQNASNDNKEYYDVDLDNHVLNISLGAGEGAFVVPFKATEVNNVTLAVEGCDNEVVKVEAGGNYVLEDRLSGLDAGKTLIGYLYGGNLYPVGYSIENITSDITLTAVYMDLQMETGASLRIDTDKEHAIRWRAFMSKSDYAAITGAYDVVGCGITVMCSTRTGALDIPISSDNFYNYNSSTYRLSGVMTGVGEQEFTALFDARAYVRIRFANGQVKKVHARANDNDRTMAYIAACALDDTELDLTAQQQERFRLIAASYGYDDNLGSLEDWISQIAGDNIGSLDNWLRLIAKG